MELDPNVTVSEHIVEEFAARAGYHGQQFNAMEKMVMRVMQRKQGTLHSMILATGLDIIQRKGDFGSYGVTTTITYGAINRHLGPKQAQLEVPLEYADQVLKRSLDIFYDPMWNVPEWALRQLEFPQVPEFAQFIRLLKAHIPTIHDMLAANVEDTISDRGHSPLFLQHTYRGVHDIFMSFYGLEQYLQSQH